MKQKLSTPVLLTFISILLLAGFGFLWWRSVYSDPQRVFKAMLENSLRLQSVTKTVEETGDNQTSRQVMRLQFGKQNIISGQTRLVQQSAAGETVVETDNIGTPAADYVRYTKITTPQTKANGEPLDFSKVLNVWGRTTADDPSAPALGELYNETVLGIVPFGVLDKAQRQELLQLMEAKNVYEVDYSAVGKNLVNGRPHYSYQLTVDAEAYITLLKRFGELHHLDHLSVLDPAAYAGQERLAFTFTVDVWSRQLQKIEYGPATSSGPRVETFTGHNGRYDVSVPPDAISVEELQLRLQSLQQ